MRQLFLYILLFSLVACHDSGQMRLLLEDLERQNTMGASMQNDDSLALALTRYFDRHGTSNERMRARYILGRTYHDRGEMPQALAAYHAAASVADTTDTDCDYHTLCRVHAQMADIFGREYLPYEMHKEDLLCQEYALKDHDTLTWLIAYEKGSQFYVMTGDKDSAIITLRNAYHLYKQHGYPTEAANCIEILPLYLVEEGETEEAKHYIELFEAQSELYDPVTQTAKHALYYYIKGMVLIASGHSSSALPLFQKITEVTANQHHLEMAYKGLYHAYMSLGEKDSVSKYADLCYKTSDQNYQNASTRELRRMQAHYNYSRHQAVAHQKEKEASQARQLLIIVATISLLTFFVSVFVMILINVRRKHQIASLTQEYEYRIEQIEKAQNELKADSLPILRTRMEKELEQDRQKLLDFLGIEKDTNAEPVKFSDSEEYEIFLHAASHPQIKIKPADWKRLQTLFDMKIPNFREKITRGKRISEKDLHLCMLIRMQFGVSEICTLMDTYSQYVSIRRSQLLTKYFKIKGKPEDFDYILAMIN